MVTNRFPGICYRCGLAIPPTEGVFEKTGHMQRKKWPGRNLPKWLTQHHECAVQYRGTTVHYIFAPHKPSEGMRF